MSIFRGLQRCRIKTLDGSRYLDFLLPVALTGNGNFQEVIQQRQALFDLNSQGRISLCTNHTLAARVVYLYLRAHGAAAFDHLLKTRKACD